jgi:hypothetical protein
MKKLAEVDKVNIKIRADFAYTVDGETLEQVVDETFQLTLLQ